MAIEKRLSQLRTLMTEAQIDYYYVPAADAHRNEYVPACWQRRAWISQFTGSAGDVVVGKTKAYLWTDGRYFLQAEGQLDPKHYQLMKQQPDTPPIHRWLCEQGKGLRIGVDPDLLTIQQQQQWEAAFTEKQSELVPIEDNWIDAIWTEQPNLPTAPIHRLDMVYTGQSTADKLAILRAVLQQQTAKAIVLTKLDAIAWLYNFRGNDIDYNPLAICYSIVTQDHATLFIDANKLSDDDRHYFASEHIAVVEYRRFSEDLNRLNTTVLLDPTTTSWYTQQQLKKAPPVFAASPITLLKARKNKTEQQGMREAHRIDGLAVVKFLHWIENHWPEGATEISAAQRLEQFRREDPRCKNLSFETISGFGHHGAIIHYAATEATNRAIDNTALYLVDSGGQYYEGTTDITRTLHLGQPTAEEKTHYTLVLKGHLALRHTPFPAGTMGEDIDPLARRPLQEAGLDYPHGTGHGVGCYLCVHEGPQFISPRPSRVPLAPGMVVSNEPGVYFPGQYGIRIENVCLIKAVDENSDHYRLEDLTLVPYARNLIAVDLLNAQEVDWIDAYHRDVYERLSPNLPETVARWLQNATKPLKPESIN